MKKITVPAVIILTIASSIFGASLYKPVQATTYPDISTQLGYIDSVLNNHEARITNVEADVKDLQTNTNTPPTTNRVVIPVSSPEPTAPQTPISPPAPQPSPVTVVSYEQIPIENSEDVDCKYTYSDDTTYQWHWKTVEYNQGTKIIRTDGKCDNTTLAGTKN